MAQRFLISGWVTLVAALFLVLVPTLFSVFTEWTKWDVLPRVAVVVAWFVAATLAAVSTTRQSRQVDELVGESLSRRDEEREVAAARLISALLAPGQADFPRDYSFRLFLMDETTGRLLPAFEPEGIDPASEGWAPGQGATGLAWATNSRVLVEGPAVFDASHGLSQAQQDRYKDLAVVAAMPVRTVRDKVIGVLSVSSAINDGHLRSPDAILEHLALAEIVARILVDMLGVRE